MSKSKAAKEAAAKSKQTKSRAPKEKAPKAGMKEKFRNSVRLVMGKKKNAKENGDDGGGGSGDAQPTSREQDKRKEEPSGAAVPTSPARKRPRLSLNKAARASQKLAPLFEKETVGPKEAAPAPSFAELAGESKAGSDTAKSTEKMEAKHCIASLHNLGNTCFLNSVLQVLRHTPGFIPRIRQLAQDVKITAKERLSLADEIDDSGEDTCEIMTWTLVKDLNTMYEKMERAERNVANGTANYLAIRPYDVLSSIEQLNPMFEGNLQHDAHELLFCLLAYIQDAGKELNKFRTKYRKVEVGDISKSQNMQSIASDSKKEVIEVKPERLIKKEVEPILSRLTSESFAHHNGLMNGEIANGADDMKWDKSGVNKSMGDSHAVPALHNGDLHMSDASPRKSPRRAAAMNSPASCPSVVRHADSPPGCKRDLMSCLSKTPEKNGGGMVCASKPVQSNTPEKSGCIAKRDEDICLMRERTMKVVSPQTKRSLEASKLALLGKNACTLTGHKANTANGVEKQSESLLGDSVSLQQCQQNGEGKEQQVGRVRSNSLTETDSDPVVKRNKRKRRSLDLLGDGPLVNNTDNKLKTDKKQPDILSMFSRKLGGIKRYGVTGKVVRSNEAPSSETYKMISSTGVPAAVNGNGSNGNAMDVDSEVSFRVDASVTNPSCTAGNATLGMKVPPPPPPKVKQTARKSLGVHRTSGTSHQTQQGCGLNRVVPPPSSVENGESRLKQTAIRQGSKAVVKLTSLDVTKYIIPKKPRTAHEIVLNTVSVPDFIAETFEGKLALRTKCVECERYTERKEDYQGVSVAVRKAKSSDGDDTDDEDGIKEDAECNWKWMMPAFEEVERLTDDNKYFCDNCKRKVEADRSSHYLTMSNILTIHLKRFAAMSGMFGGVSKINDYVPTPIILPCLKDGCRTRCNNPDHRYELYAVVTHTGISISSGHYVAYVKLAAKDESVKPEIKCEPVIQEPVQEAPMDLESTAEMADPNNNADSNNNLGVSLQEPTPSPSAALMTSPSSGAKTRSSVTLQGDPQALWMECDDDNIRVLSQREFEQILSPSGAGTPYMLFYKSMQLVGEIPDLPLAMW